MTISNTTKHLRKQMSGMRASGRMLSDALDPTPKSEKVLLGLR